MKVFIAKFFVVILIFSFGQTKELLKLPLLFAHYMEHSEKDSDLSLASFFKMHYAKTLVLDEDYEKDKQLPYRTVDYTAIPTFLLNEDKIISTIVIVSEIVFENKLNSFYTFIVTDANTSGVFHPPKFA